MTNDSHIGYPFYFSSLKGKTTVSRPLALQLIAAGCESGLHVYRLSLDSLQSQLSDRFSSALSDLQATLPGTGEVVSKAAFAFKSFSGCQGRSFDSLDGTTCMMPSAIQT